jgi:inosine-uridine nucleoside N-ribohydrolase
VRGVDAARLHDPLAVAAIIDPAIVKTEHLHVDIETRGEFTLGATVVDLRRRTGKPPNAEVALDLDLARFRKLVFDTLEILDARREGRTAGLGTGD